jgi:hypothetical protein
LNIRGFLDFNYGVGSAANALIYPLIVPQTTPPTPIHNTFQFGEYDLFMSSRLSSTINFLSEVVLGSDASNFWGLDVERAQITYKPSEYFQISGGRMHTAIGFYNTTYHHGTWFQTATGRPFMYYFEDSGGILPVHMVGLEAAGLIPHTGKVNAHWIAEVGNGESSLFYRPAHRESARAELSFRQGSLGLQYRRIYQTRVVERRANRSELL